jgi:DNA-binding winged helix-turn-helix (wHTH) protein
MGVNGKGRLQFGDFELDILSGKLCRDGRPVKIQPQPLKVLSVLLEQPGEIVSREHLRARIWGTSTFVEFDQGLNYCIRQIRLALGDEASDPIYIETLPKQGYRFIGPIAANGHVANPVRAMAPVPTPPPKKPHWKILGTAIALIAFVAAGALVRVTKPSASRQPATYAQITSFTDAAVNPVLSPDGRMVAFYRSERRFFTSDQIYAKMLPDGEPVQLTHDPRQKYNLAFSPDSSRIAYTVIENGWHTYTVSTLGGDSTLFLPNSAGLTWLDQHHLLFSEIKTGVHMGIATAGEDRSHYREIYFPAHERTMAHYSYPSPDR